MARNKKEAPVEEAEVAGVERTDEGDTPVSKNIFDRSKYTYGKNGMKTGSGRPSVDNGDAVAVAIRGKNADEVIALVAANGEEVPERWWKLNLGMQRMNAANVLRRLAKTENGVQIDGEEVHLEQAEVEA